MSSALASTVKHAGAEEQREAITCFTLSSGPELANIRCGTNASAVAAIARATVALVILCRIFTDQDKPWHPYT